MLVIAHRGASRVAPENTVEAFRLADEMGSDGVELDARLAPDGRLVVAHDPLPDDVSAVSELPDLATILEACGERMLINVEIKNDQPWDAPSPRPSRSGADSSQRAIWSGSVPESGTEGPQIALPTVDLAVVAPTIEVLHASGIEPARFLISSFSWPTIEACRQLDPRLATAALCVDAEPDQLDRIARRGHLALHPFEPQLIAERVAQCHDRGLLVTTWTCNDPERIAELAAMGVDGVCTDVPDVARDALGRTAVAVRPRWARAG